MTLGACAGSDPADEADADARRYDLSGTVVSVDREQRTVTVDHEPVADFMGAMTMPFNIRDDWVFGAAKPGASVSATLVVSGAASWLEDVVVRTAPAEGAAVEAVVPAPDVGSEVPSIDLIDQSGNTLGLASYGGTPYAFTFIYTRCPIPDFCPRMSEHFDAVYQAVASDPARYGDLRLLSLSIDPDYDTPEVLMEYAQRYLPTDEPSALERWRFATSTTAGLFELGEYTGLRFRPDGTELVHSLRTVLVGSDGRVLETFIGNSWTPEDLLGAAENAAGRGR